MDIQNLVRERVIGNIKTGMKDERGIPQKLSYFHVEQDKGTTFEMVDIFKQLYPNKPTTLKIRFTTENPFNFKFKRYVNGKAVCIGNGTEAITVGKDDRNNNIQINVECNEQCTHRQCGRCKLKGSLKFELEGINAGGVWNLSTSGGISLSNIASEIVKYKKAGMSIVGVPFELSLTEQQSLAFGTYYSIDLHRTDIKPQLVETSKQLLDAKETQEAKKLSENTKVEKNKTKKSANITEGKVSVNKENVESSKTSQITNNETSEKLDFSNYFVIQEKTTTEINNITFNKFILENVSGKAIEYILHPKADQELVSCEPGTSIELIESKIELGKNIICKYIIKQRINVDGTLTILDDNNLKEAV